MKALIERAIQQKGAMAEWHRARRMWQEGVMSARSLHALPGSAVATDQPRSPMPTQVQ